MAHRRDVARAADRRVSLDAAVDGEDAEGGRSVADTLAAPDTPPEDLDADWRRAVLKSATEHVLTKTALSDRDRNVYRRYAQEGADIGAVADEFNLSRNAVSQIKTRIDKRIVAVGRELVRMSEV